MSDDYSSSNGSEHRSWLEKLSQAFSGGEPRNREELLEIIQEAVDNKVLDTDTFNMFEGALDVSEMQVREAMVPRGQMVVVPHATSIEDLLPIIVGSGHSRFPVIKDDKDEVLGILLAKDLLRLFVGEHQGFEIDKLLRPVVFIPESKRLNVLLKDFRSSRNHMAIVVDEFGGVTGLITIEDVLEEIVGEIDDETDLQEAAHINQQAEDRYSVDALTPIEEFNEYFNAEFSEQDFDTIGGLLTGELGRLPEPGELVQIGAFDFEILKADSRRLEMLGLSINHD